MANFFRMFASWWGNRRELGVAITAALILASLITISCRAASIVATVTDERGQPLPDAVVSIVSSGNTRIAATDRLSTATIDQRDETFVPGVVVVQRGGSVQFHNSDMTRHHIYSFSPIKQFEFIQKPGDTTPVLFDKDGVAAIGCNIHDNMVAYVYVTTAPRAAVTDIMGKAEINDLPAGGFIATVWHSRLRPKSVPPPQPVTLETSGTSLAISIAVLPPRRARNLKSPY